MTNQLTSLGQTHSYLVTNVDFQVSTLAQNNSGFREFEVSRHFQVPASCIGKAMGYLASLHFSSVLMGP